jgi:hypothetical protein
MADLEINLDFIPVNLDNQPVLGQTLAKEVGKLLCETNSYEYVLEKYMLGKELYETGKATFKNTESESTQLMIEYFKKFCEEYTGFSTQIKGQILLKFK